MHMRNRWSVLGSILVLAVCFAENASAVTDGGTVYPEGEAGEMVRLGQAIINETDTHPLTRTLVGNTLQCRNCHLADGAGMPGAQNGFGSFRGTAAVFPAFSKRDGGMITLQERIEDCFIRSMDGRKPIVDSKASLAMTAYVAWLSTGVAMSMNPRVPMSLENEKRMSTGKKRFDALLRRATYADYLEGRQVYEKQCASCHQKDGSGIAGSFPALWGSNAKGRWRSYNAGAGMSKLDKAAVWIQSNMPLGEGGTLDDRDAVALSLYINAQPRAAFSASETVRANFEAFGLDIDVIRADRIIP